MKKIVITGANGFIGKSIYPLLSQLDYEVHCVSTKNMPNNNNIFWHKVNLLNTNEVQFLFNTIKPTHLLHLAWITTLKEYWNSLENFLWVQSGIEILNSFKNNGGEKVVISGTCAEYDWSHGICYEDSTPIKPNTLYGKCKTSFQSLSESFCNETSLKYCWGRIFYPYGNYENERRLISSLIISMFKNEVFECSHGNQIRDFIYIEDVASAFVFLLENDVSGIFNIGIGKPILLKDIINFVSKKFNKESLVKFGAKLPSINEPKVLISDNSKLLNIGWKPQFTLETGLEKTISWWKEQINE